MDSHNICSMIKMLFLKNGTLFWPNHNINEDHLPTHLFISLGCVKNKIHKMENGIP